MRIALIGYGKMGKTIEEIAISRGHSITARSTSKNMIDQIDFSNVDVAIEFTVPDLAAGHIQHCVDQKTPVVVGTTAWGEQLPFVKDYVIQNGGSLLYASNFSIGVNIFFDLNRRLAKLMSTHTEYSAEIKEAHHTEKADAPSGTAVSLANDILSQNENLSSWAYQDDQTPSKKTGQVGVTSFRKPGVPGTHTVQYNSEIDTIEMTHTAHNRSGFGIGAVIAAEWLHGRKGIYTMQDIIKY